MQPRLTKIIATLGPASANKRMIRELAKAGVNVFRINLSHGRHDVLAQCVRWIRETEKALKTFLGVLLDLQGPKIRVGKFEKGFIELHRGDRLTFTTERLTGSAKLVPVQYARFHKEVHPGSMVYLNDGNICVKVLKVRGREVLVEVIVGGSLSDHKGLNMPDSSVTASPLTAKDKKDLYAGLRVGVDYVALSFAGSARDVHLLQRLIRQAGGSAEVIAKVERKHAVQNLEEIVRAADGVMVARGDLGIELPLSQVPVVQQDILRLCAVYGKPAIVATQMLESMIVQSRPTRAEISDIAGSVMSCADAIMLSAETAVGQHPVGAVKVMDETSRTIESYQCRHQRILPWSWFFKESPPISKGIAYSANRMVELLDAQAIIVYTLSGGTARQVCAPHPMVPVFAFTSDPKRARQLTLLRGIIPHLATDKRDFLDDLKDIFKMLKKKQYLKTGDRVVITAGVPVGRPQWTNVIRVENVD